MLYIGLIVIAVSFLVTYIAAPAWIRKMKKVGLVGKDMHKKDDVKVAEMGGMCVLMGFIAGVFAYIALDTFYMQTELELVTILAVISTLLILAIIGMLDDILGWKKGLKQWQKPLLTLPAAIPLMAINAGEAMINLPLLGSLDVGILYPLLLIPLGVVGASNAMNMLAGYNGLEAGMGFVILASMGFLTLVLGNYWISIIIFSAAFSLLAFLKYNWYPAKVFPGDTMTYFLGALIACIAIVADIQKLALVLFLPYFIEFVLKARGRFNKESFGMVLADGSLTTHYKKIYGLEHLAIRILRKARGKCFERDVTLFILLVEILIAAGSLYFWLFINFY